jgi:hypothetical protein
MNMVDNDGNTALHLAVEAGSLQMFCPLLRNPQVNLNLPNSRGETPLDIGEYKIKISMFCFSPQLYTWTDEAGYWYPKPEKRVNIHGTEPQKCTPCKSEMEQRDKSEIIL